MADLVTSRRTDFARAADLEDILSSLGSVAVAFSGGTDSTLLLAMALRILGKELVLAITADSPTLPRRELADAQALASELGARHLIVATSELDDPRFADNPPDRCFYCKSELFGRMRQVADDEGLDHLVYGATADDLGDHRPGMQAAREAGAVAPLLEAGLTKQEVREMSRSLGLRTWNKPAMACLSSRFPYGNRITQGGLIRVEQAEDFLRHDLGLGQVRVRDHDAMARIEVEASALCQVMESETRERVISRFLDLGYTYVTLDLAGFRSGSLNEVLELRKTPPSKGVP